MFLINNKNIICCALIQIELFHASIIAACINGIVNISNSIDSTIVINNNKKNENTKNEFWIEMFVLHCYNLHTALLDLKTRTQSLHLCLLQKPMDEGSDEK